MEIFANIIGLCAVVLFVLSYQMKARRGIILCNAASRVFYVTQYILLGAFEGAVMDFVALLVSIVYKNRDKGFIKKHFLLTVILSNAVIIASGLFLYENVFSLLPILGVIFETMALYCKKERTILWVSLIAAPFWLAYNLLSSAYGSAIGSIIAIVSISIALIRQKKASKQ